jgi:hypothetical protein
MKKIPILVAVLVIVAQPCLAQMEKGDREVQAAGSIYSAEGFTVINLHGTYGYYVKPNLQIGGGPTITRISFLGFSTTTVGLTLFGRHYFTTAEKMVPYLSAQWYQFDLSPEEPLSFTDVAYVQVGAGAKYFVNEYIAWDVSANLGFGLGGGTAFLLVGGLSAFF